MLKLKKSNVAENWTVTTVAGKPGFPNIVDGIYRVAELKSPTALAALPGNRVSQVHEQGITPTSTLFWHHYTPPLSLASRSMPRILQHDLLQPPPPLISSQMSIPK
jgi:hypothetical protein